MKIKHIYTVVREFEIEPEELQEETDFFNGAIKDEAGEYLYGDAGANETITVSMEVVN